MSSLTRVTLTWKENTALKCPNYPPCYKYDNMAVWEYIRLRPVVGCLPFWGELFLAWYHMPDCGMSLLRKDKLLSMFGKLLLACQSGLYLVLVLFSQQAGKIVMMMWLEIYQGCFPRAEEDMVEAGFEFPALNLVPIFSGYSKFCSQAQACGVAAWTRAHLLWFGIGGIPTKLAILIYSLVPKTSLSLFCWTLAAAASFPATLVRCAVLATYAPRCAESRDPESSSNSHQNRLCLSSAMGTWPTYNSKSSWDWRQYEPWRSLWEFHLLCSFPLWNSNIRNFPKKWSNTMGLSYFLFILFPPQIGHRGIHCSTRASEGPSPRRPRLWE